MKNTLSESPNTTQAPLASAAITLSLMIDYFVLTFASAIAYLKGSETSHLIGMISAIGVNIILVALMLYFYQLTLKEVNRDSQTGEC